MMRTATWQARGGQPSRPTIHCSLGGLRASVALLAALTFIVLVRRSNSNPSATAEDFLWSLERAQLQHDDNVGSLPISVELDGITSGSSRLGGARPTHNALPVVIRGSVRVVGPIARLKSSDTYSVVDISALPNQPILLHAGAQLEFNGFALTASWSGRSGPQQQPEAVAVQLADRLLHEGSQGSLKLNGTVLEVTGCHSRGLPFATGNGAKPPQATPHGPTHDAHLSSSLPEWGSLGPQDLPALEPLGPTQAPPLQMKGFVRLCHAVMGLLHRLPGTSYFTTSCDGEMASSADASAASPSASAFPTAAAKARTPAATTAAAATATAAAAAAAPVLAVPDMEVRLASGALLVLHRVHLRCVDGDHGNDDGGGSGAAAEAAPTSSAWPGEGAATAVTSPRSDSAAARSGSTSGSGSGGGGASSSRQLLMATGAAGGLVVARGAGGGRRGSLGRQVLPALVLVVAVVASVGGLWLRRLLSCGCGTATAQLPADLNRAQNGSRSKSLGKGSSPMARTSQNHTLSALSRFSAQLRKGEDGSVREGSRNGYLRSASLKDPNGSVRGGKASALSPVAPATPVLFRDLEDLQLADRGRLATSLHGVWQQHQRVVVKVLCHRLDCSFMLEQVGEVWSRLAHPNIVACCAADTFPASAVAGLPHVLDLLPKPTDAEAVLQTWLVLERCDNGSLAEVLAQRAAQHPHGGGGGRKALPSAAAAAPSPAAAGGPDAMDSSPARYLARRLGRFSRGKRRSAGEAAAPADDGPNSSSVVVAPGGSGGGEARDGTAHAVAAAAATGAEVVPLGSPSSLCSPQRQSTGLPSAQHSPLVRQLTALSCAGGEDAPAAAAAATATAENSLPGLLSVAEVLSIGHDVASGLAYLHSMDLCHGDLRAENVMVQTVVLPGSARGMPAAAAATAGTNGQELDGAGAEEEAPDCEEAEEGGVELIEPTGSVSPCLRAEGGLALGPELRNAGAIGGAPPAPSAAIAAAIAAAHRSRSDRLRSGGADEMLSGMYGSNSGNSDVTDASAAVGGPRRQATNASCYNSTTGTAASCAAADSSGHVWSSSLRHSAGYMSGSTYASTGFGGLAAHAYGAGNGYRVSGVNPASVEDRPPLSETCSGGPNGGAAVPGPGPSPGAAPAFGHTLSGRGARANGTAGPSRMLTSTLAASAAGGAGGEAGVDGPVVSPFQTYSHTFSRTGSAGARGQLPAAPGGAPAMTGPPLGHGGVPFARRPSNQSLNGNNNSGNDVSAITKTLSGLTAWPESPLNDRCLGSANAGGGGTSGSAAGGVSSPMAAAAGAVAPPRKPLVPGGLKTALSSSEAAKFSPPNKPPPPQQSSPSAFAAASQVSLPVSSACTPSGAAAAAAANGNAAAAGGRYATVSTPPPLRSTSGLSRGIPQFASASAATAKATAAEGLMGPLAAARLPNDPLDETGGPYTGTDADTADPAAVPVSPRIVTLLIDPPLTTTAAGSAAPSPRGGAAAREDTLSSSPLAAAGPPPASGRAGSLPSTPTARDARGVEPSSSRSPSRGAVGLVCTIAGRSSRRVSAPPLVSLPVIRRVAKLTDPWLSLACLPADTAGGPWSPEAAAALGAVSGADVAHLPPELLLSGRLHPASDVYSLGILMWRMLSPPGEAPYGRLLPAEVAYKVVACGMRPAFSPAVPEPLRRLAEDCWQSDPATRPSVQQLLQRLSDLQPQADSLQRQWRERQALFGAVASLPISAVAVLPLRGEQNDVAARWAEAAGIRLQRAGSLSWGGLGSGGARGGGGGGGPGSDVSAHSSFARRNSLGHGSGGNAVGSATVSYPSVGASGSAAHLYQQPPPPTPPAATVGPYAHAVHFTNTTSALSREVSHHSQAQGQAQAQAAVGNNSESHLQPNRGSQSIHRYTGHLSMHTYRAVGPA